MFLKMIRQASTNKCRFELFVGLLLATVILSLGSIIVLLYLLFN